MEMEEEGAQGGLELPGEQPGGAQGGQQAAQQE